MMFDNTIRGVSGRLACHPRLVATVVALLVFVAVQDGAVAADGVVAAPNAEGSVDPGPPIEGPSS